VPSGRLIQKHLRRNKNSQIH